MSRLRALAFVVLAVALAMAGCSRSGSKATTTTSSAAKPASGDFGSLKAVCGPGDAKGATAQGVTDREITVGTMADPGSSIQPGLDQELFDTADAFVGWCNAAGGILGRTLVLHKWDAKLTEVAARMIQSCASDFSLVGNGVGLDALGVDQRVKCKLPEISTFDVSHQAGRAPLSIQALPTSDHQPDLGGAYRMIEQADRSVIARYGMLGSQVQSVNDAAERDRAGAKELGFTEVYHDLVPLQVDTYRPYVESVKNANVQVFSSQGAIIAPMFKAFHDIGWHPKYIVLSGNEYDVSFLKDAGEAIPPNVYVNSTIVPFEAASTHPATKQYVDLVAKYANGAKPKLLGAQAWSAWLLFARSAKACGSHLTRDCLMDEAGKVTQWTGGGLHGPVKPGNASSPAARCFVLMKMTPQGFEIDRELTKPNDDIFNCSTENQIDLPGFPK
jgi:ABC-type branched-subunit amino acid transport system substrate-binding protein